MVMKHYPPQFKADAVALYRSRRMRRSRTSLMTSGSTGRRCAAGSRRRSTARRTRRGGRVGYEAWTRAGWELPRFCRQDRAFV
jgi:hypothetical protein